MAVDLGLNLKYRASSRDILNDGEKPEPRQTFAQRRRFKMPETTKNGQQQPSGRMTLRDVIMQLPEENSSLDSDDDKDHYLDTLKAPTIAISATQSVVLSEKVEPKDIEAIDEIEEEEDVLSDEEIQHDDQKQEISTFLFAKAYYCHLYDA